MSKRNARMAIVDYPEAGRERERERYRWCTGRSSRSATARRSSRASWSPSGTRTPFRSSRKVTGAVKFGDILEGVTMEEKLDERTGLSTKVIVDTKDVDKRPRVLDQGQRGPDSSYRHTGEARYLLPVGAHLNVLEGQPVSAGDINRQIAARKRPRRRTSRVVLPRVAELFEARSRRNSRSSARSTASCRSVRTPRESGRSWSRRRWVRRAST